MNKEKEEALRALKTSKGQIEGIIRMIEEGRYCIDISNQLAATSSLLRKANKLIIKQHLNGCVREAFLHDKGEEKVEEVMKLLDKIIEK